MTVATIVRAEFEQVAREQEKTLAGLADDMVLLDCGLDSLCLAIIVARLEDQLGIDLFTASDDVYFPVTLGEFIAFYQESAAA
jgi:acyl carrier protein